MSRVDNLWSYSLVHLLRVMIEFWRIGSLHGNLTEFTSVIRRALAFISRTTLASIHAWKVANNWNENRNKNFVNDFSFSNIWPHITHKLKRKGIGLESLILHSDIWRMTIHIHVTCTFNCLVVEPLPQPSLWSLTSVLFASSLHNTQRKVLPLDIQAILFHYAIKQDTKLIWCLATSLIHTLVQMLLSVSLLFPKILEIPIRSWKSAKKTPPNNRK